MFIKIEMNGDDTVGFEARGIITSEDYIIELLPIFEKAHRQGIKKSFLVHLGENFCPVFSPST